MNLRFMGDWNPWVGAAVALALAIFAWVLYRRETKTNLHRPQTMLDHIAREKVSLDECAKGSSDAIFFRRHNRGVRNRNAQRMSEERRHGEPVGQTAHHSRLCRRADDGKPRPARFERASDDEQHGRENEQTGGAALHRVERFLPRCLVGEGGNRSRTRRGLRGRICRARCRHVGRFHGGHAHRGVTFTLPKSIRFVLDPAGTST